MPEQVREHGDSEAFCSASGSKSRNSIAAAVAAKVSNCAMPIGSGKGNFGGAQRCQETSRRCENQALAPESLGLTGTSGERSKASTPGIAGRGIEGAGAGSAAIPLGRQEKLQQTAGVDDLAPGAPASTGWSAEGGSGHLTTAGPAARDSSPSGQQEEASSTLIARVEAGRMKMAAMLMEIAISRDHSLAVQTVAKEALDPTACVGLVKQCLSQPGVQLTPVPVSKADFFEFLET